MVVVKCYVMVLLLSGYYLFVLFGLDVFVACFIYVCFCFGGFYFLSSCF